MKRDSTKPPRPRNLAPRLAPLPITGSRERSLSQLPRLNDEGATAPLQPSPYRVATPQTSRAQVLGDLMFAAGVLPQKTIDTPLAFDVSHQQTLISPWTRGENQSRLAHFIAPARAGEPGKSVDSRTPGAYLTDERRSHNSSELRINSPSPAFSSASRPLLQPLSSSSELHAALQRLQDNVRGTQLLSQVSRESAAVQREREERAAKAALKDVGDMNRVELWKFYHSSLPSGVQTPTFDNEEQVRYVPKSYIDRSIYDIRLDPSKWFQLKERVGHLLEERRSRADFHLVARNAHDAGRASPERRRRQLAESKASLAAKVEEARHRRDELEEQRAASIMTFDEKQRHRMEKRQHQFTLFVALGARTGLMFGAMMSVRGSKLYVQRTRAALVIQRAARKYVLRNERMTAVQAFLFRARFMRRFVTRVKAKVLLPKYAVVVRRFLQSIRFENRILMAFRRLHDCVVTAQRLVRRWLDDKRFMAHIRERQWEKCVSKRLHDFAIMAVKGSSIERDLAAKELEDLRSIPVEVMRSTLEAYRQETRKVFLDDSRAYTEACQEASRAGDARTAALLRKKIPARKPQIRLLIPAEQVDRMVRNACRKVRLARQMESSVRR